MRISDWSSDVCSSDLRMARPVVVDLGTAVGGEPVADRVSRRLDDLPRRDSVDGHAQDQQRERLLAAAAGAGVLRIAGDGTDVIAPPDGRQRRELGRAVCRERDGQYVSISEMTVTLKKNQRNSEITHG